MPSFSDGTSPRVIESSIEVDVPVSAAYNQWTQFEEFPQFMQGVEEVRQLDDTRLHWVASVGGRRAEWDAKILEQHPDRQISWISGTARRTAAPSRSVARRKRTLVRPSLGYRRRCFVEAVAPRRVSIGAGSVMRASRELIRARQATGAWRGHLPG
jgi:uncharacterized membrane protein